MAAYPTFPQLLKGSERISDDDITFERAIGGTGWGSAFYTAAKSRFKVAHVLNNTDLATLVTFYNTNRQTTFSFTWQKTATAYGTCMFTGPIREVGYESPGLTRVEVAIAEK